MKHLLECVLLTEVNNICIFKKYFKYLFVFILNIEGKYFDMEIRNCPRCGKMFYYSRNPICSECEKEEEKIFQLVKDYLEEYPKSKISDIVRDTGISAKKINKFLRDGRLEVTEGLQDFLTCVNCGKSIRTGRYCDVCSNKLSDKVKSVYTPVQKTDEKESSGPKMHHIKRGL